MPDIENCPHCNADLRGAAIPEKDRELFGGKEYFSRLIGIEDDTYDGVSWWVCPECWVVWNRWNGKINKTMHDEDWFIAMRQRANSED